MDFFAATFLKRYGDNRSSPVYYLCGEEIRSSSLDRLAEIDGILVFHDSPMLLDEFRATSIEYPSNIIDYSLVHRLAGSQGSIDLTKREESMDRLCSDSDSGGVIRLYLKHFWGDKKVRAEHEYHDLVSIFLRSFSRRISEKVSALGEQGMARLVDIEIPVHTRMARETIKGILIDTEELSRVRTNVESALYEAIMSVSKKYNFPLVQINQDDAFKILSGFFGSIEIKEKSKIFDYLRMLRDADDGVMSVYQVFKNRFNYDILKKFSNQNRVYPYFNTYGTTTGRILYYDPEVQNLSKSCRKIILPESGHSLIYVDYDQFEVGIIGSVSGAKGLIDLYNDGDVYAALSLHAFGSVTHRKIAKRIFLSYLYGMSESNIKAVSEKYMLGSAGRVINFFSGYPEVIEWKEKVASYVAVNRSVETACSGIRRFDKIVGNGNYKRAAVNHIIQGTGSLIFKTALVGIDSVYKDKVRIILPMHDAFLISAPVNESNDVADGVSSIMRDSFSRWCPGVAPKVSFSDWA